MQSNKKKILIDILHPAHVNFFKGVINQLQNDHDLLIIVRERGNLSKIVEAELKTPFIVYGKHRETVFGKMWGLFERVGQLIYLALKHSIYQMASCGFYVAIAGTILRRKSIVFYDDFEYKLNFYPSYWFATKYIIPASIPKKRSNVIHYRGFKELAYLYHFSPQSIELERMGLKPGEYVFMRLVSSKSLNYRNQKPSLAIQTIKLFLEQTNITLILSLEKGAENSELSSLHNVRTLSQPCLDIHSLMYYAKFIISSGDTVAREGALLGTPTLYIGQRDMRVNRELIEMGRIRWFPDGCVIPVLQEFLSLQRPKNRLKSEWQDTTKIIQRHLTNVG